MLDAGKKLLILMILFSFAGTAIAKTMAENAYEFWRGECPTAQPIPPDRPICFRDSPEQKFGPQLKQDFGAVTDNAYLLTLAEERSYGLACAQTQFENLEKTPADKNRIVSDISDKILEIAYEKKQMALLEPAITQDKKGAEEYKRARLRVEALSATIPFKDISSIQRMVSHLTSQSDLLTKDGPKDFFRKQIDQEVRTALTAAQKDVRQNKVKLDKAIQSEGASLDENTKESLAQDTELVETVRRNNRANLPSLLPSMCRIDAKYGRGVQYRDRAALGAFALLTGGAALATRASAALVLGTLPSRAAGVLNIMALAGGTALGVEETYKACTPGQLTLKTSNSSSANSRACITNKVESLESENCLLTATLNLLGTGATPKIVRDNLSRITFQTNKVASKGINQKNAQMEIWRLYENGETENAKKLADTVEQHLSTGAVKSKQLIGDTASRPYLVKFDDGSKGIWKPLKADYTDGNAEIAAYKIDKKLGLNAVPVTVRKDLDGKPGAIQLFVDDVDKATFKDDPIDLRFFDYLLKNPDRHQLNYMSKNGRTIAIDHSLALDTHDIPGELHFLSDLRKVSGPSEAIESRILRLEDDLYIASKKKTSNDSEVKLLTADLNKARESQKVLDAAVKTQLPVILPPKDVYTKLKETSADEWREVLRENMSDSQIKSFLQRRAEIIEGVDKVVKRFGEEVFRAGPMSSLNRASP